MLHFDDYCFLSSSAFVSDGCELSMSIIDFGTMARLSGLVA